MLELFLRLVLSLALVVGLLLLIARFANKRFKGGAGSTIRVLHRQPIGKGTAVSVVSVGTRILVIGATEQSVSLLTEVEPDEIGLDEGDLVLGELEQLEESGAAARAEVAALDDDDLYPVVTPAARSGRPWNGVPSLIPAGSALSPQTWRQAFDAVTGSTRRRAS